MDTRAHRLPLPSTATVFEVDRDKTATAGPKAAALAAAGLAPKCSVASVAADVTKVDTLVTSLSKAGFQMKEPCRIVLEGLLEYVDPALHFSLFSACRGLAAEGSRIVMQCAQPDWGDYCRKNGLDRDLPYQTLVTAQEMADAVERAGWRNVRVLHQADFRALYGREPHVGFSLIEAST
jgi:methyltransferase (TIGR00027 family)